MGLLKHLVYDFANLTMMYAAFKTTVAKADWWYFLPGYKVGSQQVTANPALILHDFPNKTGCLVLHGIVSTTLYARGFLPTTITHCLFVKVVEKAERLLNMFIITFHQKIETGEYQVEVISSWYFWWTKSHEPMILIWVCCFFIQYIFLANQCTKCCPTPALPQEYL